MIQILLFIGIIFLGGIYYFALTIATNKNIKKILKLDMEIYEIEKLIEYLKSIK